MPNARGNARLRQYASLIERAVLCLSPLRVMYSPPQVTDRSAGVDRQLSGSMTDPKWSFIPKQSRRHDSQPARFRRLTLSEPSAGSALNVEFVTKAENIVQEQFRQTQFRRRGSWSTYYQQWNGNKQSLRAAAVFAVRKTNSVSTILNRIGRTIDAVVH